MLMGTPAENAAAAVDSTPAVQFMEDMNQSEVNRAVRYSDPFAPLFAY